MKRRDFLKTAGATGTSLFVLPSLVHGEENVTAVSGVGKDLDLYAVLELLEESPDLESFEKALNDEERGINNLDLSGDGEVDYIKVDDYYEENTHLIVLQVEVEEDEFEDVATIEIEKKADTDVRIQVVGSRSFYGSNYIIEPVTTGTTVVHVHTWPLVVAVYSPSYVVWRSPWRWGVHPVWWRPWRPIAYPSYHRRWTASVRRPHYHRTTLRRSSHAMRMHRTRGIHHHPGRHAGPRKPVPKKPRVPKPKMPKKPPRPRRHR